jgi:hypothetical protein
MASSQTDLFAELAPAADPATVVFEATPDFVARIRAELNSTLTLVREAELLPWPDLTRTTLAELRFNSISRWLPGTEAAALREAFEAEMARLYEAEDQSTGAG